MRAQAELRDPRTPLDAVSLEIPTGRATPAAPTFQAVHVSSPPADAPAVVQQFLESLERRFGRTLVAHTSAYFSASLVGLSEAELLELFSIAANSIVEHHADSAGDTEDGAEDPEQQDQDLHAAGLRATTLQQLLRELRPYLSERAPQVWRWKHAVFEEVSRQRHARYLRGSHLALAAFFSGRTAQVPLILPGLKAPGMNAAPRYNLRVLEELPFQLVHCVGEKQAGWPLQVLRTLPDIESTLQAELGQYYATQLHTSPTEAAPSPKRPASALRAKGAKKAPNLGLEVLTESRDTKGAADRARQVLDALYRLRNLQRFIKMAQRAEGGWGVVRLLWPACSSTGVHLMPVRLVGRPPRQARRCRKLSTARISCSIAWLRTAQRRLVSSLRRFRPAQATWRTNTSLLRLISGRRRRRRSGRSAASCWRLCRPMLGHRCCCAVATSRTT